jgi:uncharacterized protein
MEARITRFLKRHHVLTLSSVSDQGSWTAHCFYAFMQDQQSLVFTTDSGTRHGSEMLKNPNVSAGIMLETRVIGKIRGIQLTGRAIPLAITAQTESIREVRTAYLKRFPYALAMKLDLWVLTIDYVKMTDNRLGFGKKLEWKREVRR